MEKDWLRGIPGRGKEVIDMLEKWEGKPSSSLVHHYAEDSKYILFINHNGLIDFVHEIDELAKVIMDCYMPIGLPAIKDPLWDIDGTVLIKSNYTVGDKFAILNTNEKILPVFENYAILTTDGKICYGKQHLPFKYYRPASVEEIDDFAEQLQNIGKFWNQQTKKIEDLEFY